MTEITKSITAFKHYDTFDSNSMHLEGVTIQSLNSFYTHTTVDSVIARDCPLLETYHQGRI
jgi:hypothetical protein